MTIYDPAEHGSVVDFLREHGHSTSTPASFRGPGPLERILAIPGAVLPYITCMRVTLYGGSHTPAYVFVEGPEGELLLEDAGLGPGHGSLDAADGPFDPFTRIPEESDPNGWYEFQNLDMSAFD